MPTPEQSSASYTQQVNNAISDAQQKLNIWTTYNATDQTADNPPQSTTYNTQYQADAQTFISGCYVTAYTNLIAALTAGI
jgi:hypothetical protein